MKFSYFFAVQHQQCFIYFGIPYDTSVVGQMCTMSGCVATLIEIDKEDSYIWSYMPQLCVQLKLMKDIQLHGGFVCGDEIKIFGTVKDTIHFGTVKDTIPGYKSWGTSLKKLKELPQWSEIAWPHAPRDKNLLTVQQCENYVVFFYSNGTLEVKQGEELCTSLSIPYTVKLNRYVNFAFVGADMFIINHNKMAKVVKFRPLLVANKISVYTKRFDVKFNIDVPHANGTIFCVQDTLCVVGGCDKDYEPFSDICQFDQGTQKWKQCGFASVSRFGASVVVFKGKNEKEPAIFLAGGFKGKDTPCSIIEKLSVTER